MERQEEREAWTVVSATRFRQDLGGESVDYPVRMAVCPKGHARSIPTRFSTAEFELRCPMCKRSYLFQEVTS